VPFSSDEIIKGIERHDFTKSRGKGKRGSHRTWTRPPPTPGDRHTTVTIKLNCREIPVGTLRSILRQLGIDEATLRSWVDE
jgi:predicted RNA binding protein YcfA (HicA-like mRNA interferase family)